jgi:tRNA(Ile)-lysidine synthase
MIKIQGRIPRKVAVATSGGVDSMAVVDFLKNNHSVVMYFIHHGTETSEEAYRFLREYEISNGVPLYIEYINTEVPKGVSQEEHWRNERYRFFHSVDIPVITCHHLDDCAETWIWSSLNGEGKIIPYSNGNVIRPFRLNRKEEFKQWCNRKRVEWVEDKSNSDNKYVRNYIRNELMDHALVVNPGIHTVVKKKVEKDYQ